MQAREGRFDMVKLDHGLIWLNFTLPYPYKSQNKKQVDNPIHVNLGPLYMLQREGRFYMVKLDHGLIWLNFTLPYPYKSQTRNRLIIPSMSILVHCICYKLLIGFSSVCLCRLTLHITFIIFAYNCVNK